MFLKIFVKFYCIFPNVYFRIFLKFLPIFEKIFSNFPEICLKFVESIFLYVSFNFLLKSFLHTLSNYISQTYLQFSLCTRVVPKLVLTIFGRTSNVFYRNSDKVHVFCSSLSFQQAPEDVCTSNRSRVTAGFVKSMACTSLEDARYNKKWTKNQMRLCWCMWLSVLMWNIHVSEWKRLLLLFSNLVAVCFSVILTSFHIKIWNEGNFWIRKRLSKIWYGENFWINIKIWMNKNSIKNTISEKIFHFENNCKSTKTVLKIRCRRKFLNLIKVYKKFVKGENIWIRKKNINNLMWEKIVEFEKKLWKIWYDRKFLNLGEMYKKFDMGANCWIWKKL